jgi:propanol-preferring alcohol dehydrogenase
MPYYLHPVGTYQQYIVSPARYTTRIPDGVPDHIAAPIMCSASTMVCSLEDSGLVPGEWAVFPGGGGGVGIQGVQLAKAMGFRPVVIDTGEAKRKLALDMGAEAFVDFKETPDVAEEVKKICDGIGAHGVFCTATPGYKTAIDLIGDRVSGRVMCIGLPPKDSEMLLGASPHIFAVRNLRVSG